MMALTFIVSCKKHEVDGQSIKSLGIEINQIQSNDALKNNLAISGLRLGDSISKINVVLSCDAIDGNWKKSTTQSNSEYEYLSCSDEKIEDITLRPTFRIAKTKDNKIKAISCRLMLINESTVITRNSAYFKLNHSACNTQSFGLLSPIFESSTELDSVSKILGKNPKIEKLDVFDPFADFLDNEKVMRLEYDGINIYSMRDKVVGIELLDTEAKNWKKDWK
jgi:hypothetical protein